MKTLNDFIKESLNEARRNISMDTDSTDINAIFDNFDDTVKDIWSNSGKKFPIANNVIIYPIESKLATAIMEKHQDKLPTEKEFESLIDFLIAQDSANLTSEVINNFVNIFIAEPLEKLGKFKHLLGKVKIEDWKWKNPSREFDDTKEGLIEQLLIARRLFEKYKNENTDDSKQKIDILKNEYADYFKHWNTSLEDFPDYWTKGLGKLKMFKGRAMI